jgi:hypothetical protein
MLDCLLSSPTIKGSSRNTREKIIIKNLTLTAGPVNEK